jgi:hypothetical protein
MGACMNACELALSRSTRASVHTRAIVGYTNTHPDQTHRVCMCLRVAIVYLLQIL